MATFLLWAGVIVMLGGAAILCWVLRESRVGVHPTCRSCGYDLRGIWKRIWRCPECGGDVRIVKRGDWKFDWRLIAGPVLLIMLGLSLGGVALAPRIHRAFGTPPAPPKPANVLLAETLSFDRKIAAAAFIELRARLDAHELNPLEHAVYLKRLEERDEVEKLVRNLPESARTIGEATTALTIWKALVDLGVDAPMPKVDDRYLPPIKKREPTPDPAMEPTPEPDGESLNFDVF